MKIDPNYRYISPDQTVENNKALNRMAGTTYYQANKIQNESDKLQDSVNKQLARPNQYNNASVLQNILKKLNII